MFFKLFKKTDGNIVIGDVSIISKKVIHVESVRMVISKLGSHDMSMRSTQTPAPRSMISASP